MTLDCPPNHHRGSGALWLDVGPLVLMLRSYSVLGSHLQLEITKVVQDQSINKRLSCEDETEGNRLMRLEESEKLSGTSQAVERFLCLGVDILCDLSGYG